MSDPLRDVDPPLGADHPFVRDLAPNPANRVALTPVSFLERSALIWPDKIAVRHGRLAYAYREFEARCRRLASALAPRGVRRGDTVAVMAPNVPAMLEAHYAVPALGAVLNALNFRHDAATIAFCLDHGEAKVLLTDAEFAPTVKAALASDAARDRGRRHRRSGRSRRANAWASSPTKRCWPKATPRSPGLARTTNGIRSRCSTRRARPAIRRASSTTTAARI